MDPLEELVHRFDGERALEHVTALAGEQMAGRFPGTEGERRAAQYIASVLDDMGCAPYLVAGLVRDLLLNSPIVDIDMVIEGDAIELARRLARELGGRVRTHGQFGTAHWTLSDDVWSQIEGFDGGVDVPYDIDLVTARTEFYTHPSALPEVASSSIKQDLHRRDFTINGLFYDPVEERVIDFVGGQGDLTAKVLRAIGQPRQRFSEDKLRMLRAVRFSATFDFELEYQMALINRQLAPEIESVCLITRQENAFLSSSILKEVALLGGNVSEMTPPHIAAALEAKRRERERNHEPVPLVSLRD